MIEGTEKLISSIGKHPTLSATKFSMCVSEDTFYLLTNELWCFSSDFQWKQIFPLPFCIREGQSMTSTPLGVAFFGGFENDHFHNDLWIYHKGEWIYVACRVPSRAYHTAAWDDRGFLLISGGRNNENNLLSDMFLIDPTNQETFEVSIPNLPTFYDHSITCLTNGKFAIFGKTSNHDNHEFYTFDLQQSSCSKVDTPFDAFCESYHYSNLIFNMLFIFIPNSDKVWMFEFTHNIWVPLIFNFLPIYGFLSHDFAFSENKTLFMLNNKLTKVISYQLFSEPPTNDFKNHPQFINFLSSSLNEAIKYFEQMESPFKEELREEQSQLASSHNKLSFDLHSKKIVEMDLSNEIFEMEDEIRLLQKSISKANSINFPKVQIAENKNSKSEKADLSKIVKEIISVKQKKKKE